MVPESDHKWLKNIRKIQERAKHKEAEELTEEEKKEEGEVFPAKQKPEK